MAGFIVGFDNDRPDIFERQIQFIQKSGIIVSMVGLLQAPYGTQLYERLRSEGRILTEMTGDNADGTTNIVTSMDPRTLSNGYQSVIQTIFSPDHLYPRIKTFLKVYNPRKSPVHMEIAEVKAFLRSIFKLGIFNIAGWRYWDLFFWTLINFPAKLPLAITMTIYGYHFQKIAARAIQTNPGWIEKVQKARKIHMQALMETGD